MYNGNRINHCNWGDRRIEMRQKAFLGLLISFGVLGIFAIVYAVVNPERNVVAYISGSATVVIAVLTMAYVYVTSRQLDVMGRQLEQMEIDRRLENQPLPYVNNIRVRIEKPRLYHSAPEFESLAESRYWVYVKIRNVGNHPAICIDVSARIEIPLQDRKKYFRSVSINVPAIGEKENYPANTDGEDDFLFATDGEGLFIQALREPSVNKMPSLSCRILFRNILGGCFVSNCRYRLYPKKEEDLSLFGEWLSGMKSFHIKYKNDIVKLGQLEKSNAAAWGEEFERLKGVFAGYVGGEDAEADAWPMPGSFAVKSITEVEYEKELEDVSYGVRKAEAMECIAK